MRRLLESMTGWLTATEESRAEASTVLRGPLPWLLLCGALLAAAILAGTAYMIGEFRERALANRERELENTVLLLTRHFDQQVQDSDLIAHNIIAQLGIAQITSPEDLRRKISGIEMHELLRSQVGVLSHIGDLNFFDADGKLVN